MNDNESIEEPHKLWDKTDFVLGKDSARCMPVGFLLGYKLIDKVIMPVNICPHCNSKNTYHKRIQKCGDHMNNVYNYKRIEDQNGKAFFKFDYCFECSKEFLIECLIYKQENLLRVEDNEKENKESN